MTTKNDFMDRLDALTAALPESERERLKTYFAEMIDDRVEMGMDEESAIRALGTPEELLRDVAPAALTSAAGDDHACAGEIREVRIHMKNADVQVLRQSLTGGMSAQLFPQKLKEWKGALRENGLL